MLCRTQIERVFNVFDLYVELSPVEEKEKEGSAVDTSTPIVAPKVIEPTSPLPRGRASLKAVHKSASASALTLLIPNQGEDQLFHMH